MVARADLDGRQIVCRDNQWVWEDTGELVEVREIQLGSKVKLRSEGGNGVVMGVACYLDRPRQYCVRHKSASDGLECESWCNAEAMDLAE